MNGILPLVSSMAWPLALVALAAMFRREIGQATGRLGRVKYRDLEVNFREELRQVEALAQAMPATAGADVVSAVPLPGQPLLESNPGDLFGPLLGGSMIVAAQPTVREVADCRRKATPVAVATPREVIVDAWSDLGQTLIRAALRRGDRRSPKSPMRPDDAVKFLVMKGGLNAEEAQLFEGLSKLWSQIDQLAGASLGDAEARRFAEATSRLAARIVSRS